MIEIIILYFLSRSAGVKARNKGYAYNKYFWRSVLFYVLGLFMGSILVVIMLHYKGINVQDPIAVVDVVQHNYLYNVLVLVIAIGGSLLVRYQVEQLPDNTPKNPPDDIKWG